jgi:hypothetical protein
MLHRNIERILILPRPRRSPMNNAPRDIRTVDPVDVARIERDARAYRSAYVAEQATRAFRWLAESIRQVLRNPFQQGHA